MFGFVWLDKRVPADRPLRAIRRVTDETLEARSPHLSRMYSQIHHPSIPLEQIPRSLVLQVLYTIRNERMLSERLLTTDGFTGSSASHATDG